jgi:hypothetical protein
MVARKPFDRRLSVIGMTEQQNIPGTRRAKRKRKAVDHQDFPWSDLREHTVAVNGEKLHRKGQQSRKHPDRRKRGEIGKTHKAL